MNQIEVYNVDGLGPVVLLESVKYAVDKVLETLPKTATRMQQRQIASLALKTWEDNIRGE